MTDDVVSQLVNAWYRRERDAADDLLDRARNAETVVEMEELAHEAKIHLARCQAYLDVLALVGMPEDEHE